MIKKTGIYLVLLMSFGSIVFSEVHELSIVHICKRNIIPAFNFTGKLIYLAAPFPG